MKVDPPPPGPSFCQFESPLDVVLQFDNTKQIAIKKQAFVNRCMLLPFIKIA
jgi:hypothetical protein